MNRCDYASVSEDAATSGSVWNHESITNRTTIKQPPQIKKILQRKAEKNGFSTETANTEAASRKIDVQLFRTPTEQWMTRAVRIPDPPKTSGDLDFALLAGNTTYVLSTEDNKNLVPPMTVKENTAVLQTDQTRMNTLENRITDLSQFSANSHELSKPDVKRTTISDVSGKREVAEEAEKDHPSTLSSPDAQQHDEESTVYLSFIIHNKLLAQFPHK